MLLKRHKVMDRVDLDFQVGLVLSDCQIRE
jgi:hypothetical protein